MRLEKEELTSIFYHDIFDYPLNTFDLIRWRAGKKTRANDLNFDVTSERGYFFIKGRRGLIFKRLLREKSFARKFDIAKKEARIISFLPTVQGVGITGSLAMKNAKDISDIDLIVITKKGTLWTTRLFLLLLLRLFGLPTRKFGEKEERDKLCLNMWLDERVMLWPKSERNVYTAHEILQIIPLANKQSIFERFLWTNRWAKDYWPNAMRIQKTRARTQRNFPLATIVLCARFLEPLARNFQYLHMRRKITREVVSKTKMLFHPQDWGEIVEKRFYS